MPNYKARGLQRERDLKKLLENCGWFVLRAPASLGPVDVLAIATGQAQYPAAMRSAIGDRISTPSRGSVLLIEAKSTSKPFERFGPTSRRTLLNLANSIAAAAWLAWKPSGATRWTWIPTADWPSARRHEGNANLPKTAFPIPRG